MMAWAGGTWLMRVMKPSSDRVEQPAATSREAVTGTAFKFRRAHDAQWPCIRQESASRWRALKPFLSWGCG
jgi:hypothetical protein